MAWPIDSTFISEILPARARASVFALRSGTWNLGWSIASLIGGAIIVHSGYKLTFVSLIVFTTISVLPFVTYYARHPLVLAGQVPSAIPIRRRLAAEAEAVAAAAAAEEPAPQTQAA
jgi:MFS family permease